MYVDATNKQAGAALITGLVILVLLTLIGVTAMRGTLMEEKMAGNLKNQYTAFQSAEAALRVGETYLTSASIGPFAADASSTSLTLNALGLYQPTLSATQERWEQANMWTDAGSLAYPRTPTSATATLITPSGAAGAPRYIVEDMSYKTQCSNATECTNTPIPATPGGSLKFGALPEVGLYRITARGVGASLDTVVFLQSYYRR